MKNACLANCTSIITCIRLSSSTSISTAILKSSSTLLLARNILSPPISFALFAGKSKISCTNYKATASFQNTFLTTKSYIDLIFLCRSPIFFTPFILILSFYKYLFNSSTFIFNCVAATSGEI